MTVRRVGVSECGVCAVLAWDRGTADWYESRRAVLFFGVPCICFNIVNAEEPSSRTGIGLAV